MRVVIFNAVLFRWIGGVCCQGVNRELHNIGYNTFEMFFYLMSYHCHTFSLMDDSRK